MVHSGSRVSTNRILARHAVQRSRLAAARNNPGQRSNRAGALVAVLRELTEHEKWGHCVTVDKEAAAVVTEWLSFAMMGLYKMSMTRPTGPGRRQNRGSLGAVTCQRTPRTQCPEGGIQRPGG